MFIGSILVFGSCTTSQPKPDKEVILSESPKLTVEEAHRLASLPLHCIDVQYPNKLQQVLEDESQLLSPKTLHPAFYGCFDWHSSVHGHWSIVALLKKYPDLENREELIQKIEETITKEHIEQEVAYFQSKTNKSFERTYGWAWLLKLQEELHTWNEPRARLLEENLQPLADHIVASYLEFLPKLNYPIRTGEHPNTAFGLSFAHDYATTFGRTDLEGMINQRSKEFYLTDQACPLTWEPSGFDFLSPCLEEVDIMRRVLPKNEFLVWIREFLPQLENRDFEWLMGEVSDRTDGKLVHLDGLNFSRAWCLYGLVKEYAEFDHLKPIADEHVRYSLPSIVDDNYEGTHWLGSFAIYALLSAEQE